MPSNPAYLAFRCSVRNVVRTAGLLTAAARPVRILAAVGVLSALTACGGGGDSAGVTPPVTSPPAAVASVELSGAPAGNLTAGATAVLSATTRDANGAILTGRSIVWSSSAPTVATVNNGTVTAVARGTATITASSEGRSAAAMVNVITLPARIELTYSSGLLLTGDTMTVSTRVLDAQGAVVPEAALPVITLSSVALTNASGLLTAAAVGNAILTATSGTLTRTALIRIFPGGGQRVSSLSRIDSLVVAEMERLKIPAASIAVSNGGRLLYARAYGYADTATKRIAAPNQLYRIGSTTKPLTAVATLKLIQDGLLRLDDKPFTMLTDIPPRGGTEDPQLAQITVRDLLQHTTGWNANRAVDDTMWAGVWRDRVLNPKLLASYGRGVRLNVTPGTAYAYTNYSFQVLGRLIERVTGQSYETYVRSAILTPAGVTTMKLGRTPLSLRDPLEVSCYDNLSTTTGQFGAGKWCDVVGEQEYSEASGSFIASSTDMLRWMSVVDGVVGTRPDVLSAATITTMTGRPSYAGSTGAYYALGWQVVPEAGGNYWTHSGAQVGGDGVVGKLPNGLSFSILANLTRGMGTGGGTLDQALVPLIRSIPVWPTGTSF